MLLRRPVVLVSGRLSELPVGDTLLGEGGALRLISSVSVTGGQLLSEGWDLTDIHSVIIVLRDLLCTSGDEGIKYRFRGAGADVTGNYTVALLARSASGNTNARTANNLGYGVLLHDVSTWGMGSGNVAHSELRLGGLANGLRAVTDVRTRYQSGTNVVTYEGSSGINDNTLAVNGVRVYAGVTTTQSTSLVSGTMAVYGLQS